MKIDNFDILYPDELYRLNDECERFPQSVRKIVKKVEKSFKTKDKHKNNVNND